MIDLALAVACGLAIGMIFKVVARSRIDRMSLLTSNYAAAFLLSCAALLFGGAEGSSDPSVGLIALGIFTGSLFIVGFFVLALSTALAGMSLATAVMRISVVIPFVASWLVWNEVPSTAQIAGLITAAVAFFLISLHRRSPVATEHLQEEPARILVVLAALFLVGGTVDTMMKTFDEVFADDHRRSAFMALVFGVAFVIGAAVLGVRRLRSGKERHRSEMISSGKARALRALGWGLLLGAVNFGSVEFILRAIRQLSGPFVFPANNIGLVLGGALLGVTVWNERLSPLNWTGLALAAFALLLLNY